MRITIDIFSGRENPVIELTKDEAQKALERLRPLRKLEKGEKLFPSEPTLGYRGLIIEQVGEPAAGLPKMFWMGHGAMFGPDLAHLASDEAFEHFVCGSDGLIKKLKDGDALSALVMPEIKRFQETAVTWPKVIPIPPVKITCQCAPLYEPDWWNDGGQKQFHNNCYNYGCDYRTDTFAQPGRAAGAMYTAFTCAAVKPAAVKDCLIDSPNADNKCPAEGHLVALVIWPNQDFHWYRMNRNGFWSHKPGQTNVTNIDNSGNLIPDPRTANRGPYTDFCTFMVVMHGHIKIN